MIGILAGLAAVAVATPQTVNLPQYAEAEAQALDLAKKAIAFRSVAGPGNQTPQLAALFKSALVAGGFVAGDIEVTPVDDTAYIIARWRGTDPTLKPLVISGHIDVVEAKREDWQRDPFTPVVENGFLYGRGATDMKLDGAIAIASLIELKREGYVPRRDIIIEFSGDEETAMKTSEIIAQKLANADLVLNIDGGNGTLNEATEKPEYFSWQGAEKTYADYELTVTSPGGHSSRPRRDNAINVLSAALVRIGNYRFKPEVSPLMRAYFKGAAAYEPPKTGAAMRAFAANPTDPKAIATLAADPALVGGIGTTCVTTMINGGHAPNALPQRVTANINCRIYPGHKPTDIMTELKRVAAEPSMTIKYLPAGSVATDASPMRPDFIAAVTKGINAVYPGVPVFPSMAAGASDSMWFRHLNVPSYGASPVFIKGSEDFSHGLNERDRLSNIRPAINYYLIVVRDLSD